MLELQRPKTPAGSGGEPELGIVGTVGFLRRSWRWILGGAALGGLLAVGTLLWLPPVYEAAATMLVVPPAVASELKPSELSVQGYETLLASGAVVEGTRQRLMEDGLLEPGDELAVGSQLETRIFISRKEETTSLAPMIEAVARADTGAAAAAIANAWADVFLRHSRDLAARATAGAVEFVDQQFPGAVQSLADKEAEWLALSDELDAEYEAAAERWELTLARFRQATQDEVVNHQAATRSRMAEALAEALGEVGAAGGELAAMLRRLASVRVELAQTRRVLTLRKTIPDEALWGVLLDEEQRSTAPLESLTSEEPNPAHADLALRAVELETEIWEAGGSDDETVRALVARLADIQGDRSGGLVKLERSRADELARLERRRDQELARLDRHRSIRLGQVRREVDQLGQVHHQLARGSTEAALAKGQEELAEVHLAAAAVAPGRPEGRDGALKAALAALLGALLGFGVALFRELDRATAAG